MADRKVAFNWDDVVIPEEEAKALIGEPIQEKPIDLSQIGQEKLIGVSQKQVKRQRTFTASISEEDIDAVRKLKGGLGYTFRVFYAIYCQVTLEKNAIVTLPTNRLVKLGLTRDATSRGLHILESAGFISVTRQPGRSARITLLARTAPIAQSGIAANHIKVVEE